jgi:hypothetical protein
LAPPRRVDRVYRVAVHHRPRLYRRRPDGQAEADILAASTAAARAGAILLLTASVGSVAATTVPAE